MINYPKLLKPNPFNTYYIVAPETPNPRLKQPYQKFNTLSDAFLSDNLRYPSKNRLYCLLEYTNTKGEHSYSVYKVTMEKLHGEPLDNFLKAGLKATS